MQRTKIILASKSPRRQELLRQMGVNFEVQVEDVDESYPNNLNPVEVAKFIAEKKAKAYTPNKGELIITADTIVVLDKRILGKPSDRAHAIDMLQQLSGCSHQVITGVSLVTESGIFTFSEETRVTFRTVKNIDIEFYIDQYAPFDKAGSYGVQDWWGLTVVEKIEGSYTNVMGLPTEPLYRHLARLAMQDANL